MWGGQGKGMALVVKAGKRQRGSWAFASRARRGHSHALSHSVGGGPCGVAKAKGGTGVRKGKAEQGTLGKWSPVGSGTTRKGSAATRAGWAACGARACACARDKLGWHRALRVGRPVWWVCNGPTGKMGWVWLGGFSPEAELAFSFNLNWLHSI